jgi:hypothetical protein
MEGQSPKLGKNITIAQNDVSQTQPTLQYNYMYNSSSKGGVNARRSLSPSNVTLHMASQVGVADELKVHAL